MIVEEKANELITQMGNVEKAKQCAENTLNYLQYMNAAIEHILFWIDVTNCLEDTINNPQQSQRDGCIYY